MRHAYHSPDMILKIRRANEATAGGKGLGVPWRHRLSIRERKEFVMAEIRRPGVGRERSRGSELDIQRAVTAARNPKESKFGECLINVNTKEDPVLKLRLGKISTEMRRMEFKMQQQRQHFVKTTPCLNHEPLILVERPPSPHVRRRAKVIEDYGEDPEHLKLPGYMRPLRSRCRTPSTLTTIDAFTLKTKKKRNVWEQAMDEKQSPQFVCTVRPSAKLTRREVAALNVGYDAHKPRVDMPEKTKPERPHSAKEPITHTPFVTQLPRKELPAPPPQPPSHPPSPPVAHSPLLKVMLDHYEDAPSSQTQKAEHGHAADRSRPSTGHKSRPSTGHKSRPSSGQKSRPSSGQKRRVAIVEKPFFITQSTS